MNPLLRALAWLLAIALVLAPVVALVNGWLGAQRWPLRTLRVSGEFQRVDAQRVRAVLQPFARHGFFAVPLAQAQAAVAALPWVEQAEVRKRWPDVLVVRVVEHRPFARWGAKHLLSERGRLFPATGVRIPAELPALDGPDGRVAEVVAVYNESRALFAPSASEVRAVALDARGSWTLRLGSGTQVVLGRSDTRPRMQRFARLLPQLLAQHRQSLLRADLRYTNGFALSWANSREPADATKAPAAADERPAMEGRAGLTEAATATPWRAAITGKKIKRTFLRTVNA